MSGRVGLFACGLAAALAAGGCRSGEAPLPPPTPVGVQTVEAYAGTAGPRYSATVQPHRQVALAFKSGGYVQMLLQLPGADGRPRDVQEGDRVRRGTILARVREAEYAAQLEQARGQLIQAEQAREAAAAQLAEATAARARAVAQLGAAAAAAEKAGRDMERATTLYAAQSLTRPEYDQAKARLDETRALVEAARAQIAGAEAGEQAAQRRIGAAEGQAASARGGVEHSQVQLRDTALEAPMDALVLKRSVETGDLAQPGRVGFILAEVGTVKVVFGVPDVVVSRLRLGGAQSITVETLPGLTLRGRISRIAPSADPQSRTFEVEVTVPNPQDRLKVGGIASLELPGERPAAPVPAVPVGAIVRPPQDPAGYAVFVTEEQAGASRARLRPVTLGETYGNLVGVTRGLAVGERVVVAGATRLRDGESVRILP